MKKLSDIGLLKKDLLASISTATKKSVREVNALVTKALQESSWNDSQTLGSLSHYRNMSKADYIAKITQSETFQKVLDKTLAGVKNGLNLTNTKALQGSVIAYTKAINNAYLAMATGNTTFEDAVRNAVSQIGLSGISIVDSKSKVRDNELIKKNGQLFTTYSDGSKIRMYPLDSAVRRDITTQINQASATLTLQDCQELGVTLVETSWHNGARPEHEVWQGQVFSLDPNNTKYGYFYGSLDAGLPAYGDTLGICGINCYHSFSPYLEGSPRADQTGKKSAEENAKQYANQQKQRAYERNLRALKYQQLALKSCNYNDEANLIQNKINTVSANYKQFLKDTGLTRVSILERIIIPVKEKANIEIPQDPIRFDNIQKADNYFRKNNFNLYWKKLTKEEQQAVIDYTGKWYKDMNNLKRNSNHECEYYPKREVEKHIALVSSALNKCQIKEPVVLYRGISSVDKFAQIMNVDSKKIFSTDCKKALVGRIFPDAGFSSTTVIEKKVLKNKEVIFEIVCSDKIKGLYVNPVSNFKKQYEVLLQEGLEFNILDVRVENEKLICSVFAQKKNYSFT